MFLVRGIAAALFAANRRSVGLALTDGGPGPVAGLARHSQNNS